MLQSPKVSSSLSLQNPCLKPQSRGTLVSSINNRRPTHQSQAAQSYTNHGPKTGNKRGKKQQLQKLLVLTASSIQTRNQLGTPDSINGNESEQRAQTLKPSLSQNNLKVIEDTNRSKFMLTQASSFYKQPFSPSQSVQQTYQMFMPNKIKKNWNFKANFDFAKEQKYPQQKGQNPHQQLHEVLNKIRPIPILPSMNPQSDYQMIGSSNGTGTAPQSPPYTAERGGHSTLLASNDRSLEMQQQQQFQQQQQLQINQYDEIEPFQIISYENPIPPRLVSSPNYAQSRNTKKHISITDNKYLPPPQLDFFTNGNQSQIPYEFNTIKEDKLEYDIGEIQITNSTNQMDDDTQQFHKASIISASVGINSTYNSGNARQAKLSQSLGSSNFMVPMFSPSVGTQGNVKEIPSQQIQPMNNTGKNFYGQSIHSKMKKCFSTQTANQGGNSGATSSMNLHHQIQNGNNFHIGVKTSQLQTRVKNSLDNGFNANNPILGKLPAKKDDLSSIYYKVQISPYGDQHNLNDMVYSGGFLLKPRSKYQNFDHHAKRQQLQQSLEEKKKITDEEKQKIIQVKSLDQVIKKRQEMLQKIQSEKIFDIENFDNLKIHKSAKQNENILKTLKYLKKLQLRPPSQQNELSPDSVNSPKVSNISYRPMTRSDCEHSPVIFQNPIQKVLITHKDQESKKEPKFQEYQMKVQELNLDILPNTTTNRRKSNEMFINNDIFEVFESIHDQQSIPYLSKQTLEYLSKTNKNRPSLEIETGKNPRKSENQFYQNRDKKQGRVYGKNNSKKDLLSKQLRQENDDILLTGW